MLLLVISPAKAALIPNKITNANDVLLGSVTEENFTTATGPAGTPVYAICDGVATYYQITGNWNGKKNTLVSYGNFVELKSGNIVAKYGHLNSFKGISLKYGNAKNPGSTYSKVTNYKKNSMGRKNVKKGDIIGYVGTTGNSTGNHLHFELWLNGKRQEPNNYF